MSSRAIGPAGMRQRISKLVQELEDAGGQVLMRRGHQLFVVGPPKLTSRVLIYRTAISDVLIPSDRPPWCPRHNLTLDANGECKLCAQTRGVAQRKIKQ